jgi:methylmalonyl-CoA mutase
MRRILQATGAEVIHLGHNRSVQELVDTAIQEDAQGIAVSSYQGGHMEYFTYMHDLLEERGAGHIQIFGGGGGVIVEDEIEELEAYGIARIFSPEDGMELGLQGMINEMMRRADEVPRASGDGTRTTDGGPRTADPSNRDPQRLAQTLSQVESPEHAGGDGQATGETPVLDKPQTPNPKSATATLGITGTGGAGKSTLTDELVRRFLTDADDTEIAVLAAAWGRR